MYLVYILKHLIEKAYARFFKTIFLFVCLITDNKSIMREKKKRNKLPLKTIDLLIPDHAPVGGCVCVDVCMGSTVQTEAAGFHTHAGTGTPPRPLRESLF